MTVKTITLDIKTDCLDNDFKSAIAQEVIPTTTLYLNENVIFSEISEISDEEKIINSKSIDIDFTQQNTFRVILSNTDDSENDEYIIILNPVSETGYSINLNVTLPSLSFSDYQKKERSQNFLFKINDTTIHNLSNLIVEDLPITSNSTINWNVNDKLSFNFSEKKSFLTNSVDSDELITRIITTVLDLKIT